MGEGVGEGGREGAAELPGAGRVPGSDGGAGRLPAPGAGLRGGAPGTGFSFPPSRGSSRGPAGIPAASGRPLAAHRPRPVRLWQGTAGKRRHGRGVWGPVGSGALCRGEKAAGAAGETKELLPRCPRSRAGSVVRGSGLSSATANLRGEIWGTFRRRAVKRLHPDLSRGHVWWCRCRRVLGARRGDAGGGSNS